MTQLVDDGFHLDLAVYLGADPRTATDAFLVSLDRLTTIRDTGKPGVALAEAEGSVRAALAYLESVVGPDDMVDALSRCMRGCRRRSNLSAYVTGLSTRGSAP